MRHLFSTTFVLISLSMCCVIKASLVSTCAFSGKAYELHDKLQEDYPRGWVEACRTRGGHSLILEDIEEAVMASAFPDIRLDITSSVDWRETGELVSRDMTGFTVGEEDRIDPDCAGLVLGVVKNACQAQHFVCELPQVDSQTPDCIEPFRPVQCPGRVYKGHCYWLVTGPLGINWHASQRECMIKGGHLATLTSTDEITFVQNEVLPDDGSISGKPAWVGLSSAGNGDHFNFTWRIDEVPYNLLDYIVNPWDVGLTENEEIFFVNSRLRKYEGKWGDWTCTAQKTYDHRGVCEYEEARLPPGALPCGQVRLKTFQGVAFGVGAADLASNITFAGDMQISGILHVLGPGTSVEVQGCIEGIVELDLSKLPVRTFRSLCDLTLRKDFSSFTLHELATCSVSKIKPSPGPSRCADVSVTKSATRITYLFWVGGTDPVKTCWASRVHVTITFLLCILWSIYL